jgi:hypothetical protein
MPIPLTRRELAMVGASTLVGSETAVPFSARPTENAIGKPKDSRAFPPGFLWGTATSSRLVCTASPRPIFGEPLRFAATAITLKPERRFPPPWSVEETEACFIVRDGKTGTL